MVIPQIRRFKVTSVNNSIPSKDFFIKEYIDAGNSIDPQGIRDILIKNSLSSGVLNKVQSNVFNDLNAGVISNPEALDKLKSHKKEISTSHGISNMREKDFLTLECGIKKLPSGSSELISRNLNYEIKMFKANGITNEVEHKLINKAFKGEINTIELKAGLGLSSNDDNQNSLFGKSDTAKSFKEVELSKLIKAFEINELKIKEEKSIQFNPSESLSDENLAEILKSDLNSAEKDGLINGQMALIYKNASDGLITRANAIKGIQAEQLARSQDFTKKYHRAMMDIIRSQVSPNEGVRSFAFAEANNRAIVMINNARDAGQISQHQAKLLNDNITGGIVGEDFKKAIKDIEEMERLKHQSILATVDKIRLDNGLMHEDVATPKTVAPLEKSPDSSKMPTPAASRKPQPAVQTSSPVNSSPKMSM